MGARQRVGIGFSYRPARLRRLADFIPWNQFLGSINIKKYVLISVLQVFSVSVKCSSSIFLLSLTMDSWGWRSAVYWPFLGLSPTILFPLNSRARICKRSRSPGIDSEELIPPTYVAWRAGTANREGCRTGPPGWKSIPELLKCLQVRAPSRPSMALDSPIFLLGRQGGRRAGERGQCSQLADSSAE
jgi:hypothetical protein